MLEVRLMRREGIRLPENEIKGQPSYQGDFVLDTAHGARRLRLQHPFAGWEGPELYEPVMISARHGVQIWRGFERAGERGVVQEWYVLAKR